MRPKPFYEKKLEENGVIQDCQIICPHCFQENESHELDLNMDGSRESDINCEHCNEEMDIKVEVTKCYTTRKATGSLKRW